jgi:VWFA-related protein
MKRRELVIPAGLAVLLVAATALPPRFVAAQAGQATQSPSAPGVTFQTEVTYVDVDASVTDEQGKFVGSLTREDFQIFEDGKPQKIDTFSLVEIPLERQDRFLFMEKPVRSDVKSNRRPFAGRLYVIVLDDLDVSPFRTGLVRKFAHEFVEKYFGANDLAAVVYTSGRSDASQEFTNDPQLLLTAIDKFLGRRLRSETLDTIDARYTQMVTQGTQNEEDASQATSLGDKLSSTRSAGEIERGYRARGVLDTLKNLSEFLSAVRGRRKALLLFSEGIDYPLNDVFGTNSGSDVMRATQDAISAAARANVNFFTLDPRGLIGMSTEFIEMQGSGMPEVLGSAAGTPTSSVTPFNGQKDLLAEMRVSQDSLRSLAEETGGIAAINANSLTPAFERIVDGNSRYYVLGYYPPTHPRDGRFHKIEVRVSRPGLKVSARKGYASARGKTPEERRRDEEARRASDARKPLADNTSTELREVLGSALPQSGLTFSVQAAAFRNTSKDASVALAIDLDGDRLPFDQQPGGLYANQVELSLFNVNEEGKAQRGVRAMLNLTIRPETYQRVKTDGVRANPRIILPPGRYQLRVGARENLSGRTGTVFYDLQVPDFNRQPLMLGGLLLSAPSAQQSFAAVPDPAVAKLLPGSATSRREFRQSDTLSLLAEIYDNDTSRQVRYIEATVRLIGESGVEAFAAHDSLTNGGLDTKKWEGFSYAKDIPLKAVAPGRYLLRVEAEARGTNYKDRPSIETVITVR